MTCIRPAGRRGACSCGNQYAQILDRLDTVEQESSDAKTTAQTAANTASIQAANAASSAAAAALDAADALLQAGNAAASAATAAQDAGNAAADLASINSTISSTLTTYLGTKVDKLTTTGSFAYTHTNATQGETALVNGTTSNTIPVRDGNGRMQAADPASGATDKTLVTANWASQDGDSSPNNLLHKTGTETKTGQLNLPAGMYGIRRYYSGNSDTSADNIWRKAFEVNLPNGRDLEIEVSCHFNNTDVQNARVKIVRTGTNSVACIVIRTEGSTSSMASPSNYVATLDDGIVTFYVYKRRRYTTIQITPEIYTNYGGYAQMPTITFLNTASNDPSSETHDSISVGTIVPYRNGV